MLSEVPDGWAQESLDSVFSVITKGTTPTSVGYAFESSGVPFIKVENISASGKITNKTSQYISEECHAKLARSVIEKGAILFSIAGTIGKVALYEEDYQSNTNQALAILRGLNEDAASKGFIFQLLKSTYVYDTLQSQRTVGAQPNISLKQLKELVVNLPPLTEQKRIAEVLSSVDESIQTTQRLIEQAERVKQGLMEELLTGGLGSEAIERGEVPEGWTIKQLSELAAVKGGKRMPKGAKFSETPTEYPYIRVVDFENGTISTENLRFVSEEHQKQIARYTISQDDLYISIAGTLGLVGLVPASLNGAQLTENAAKIVLNDRAVIKKEYLALFLQSSLGQNQIFVKKGVGGGVPKLALFRIGEILVAYPSAEKQVNIISKVSSLSDTRKSNEVKLKQLEKLKKGLMDDLLTGKVRTV